MGEKRSTNELVDQIQNYFPSFESFRYDQENIIKALLKGKDVVSVFPTGGGKSLCYQFAASQMDGVTIVVSPLVSLIQDQVKNLNDKKRWKEIIPAAGIVSSNNGEYVDTSRREQEKILEDAMDGKIKLLYVSPERLQLTSFIRMAKKMNISMVVVDEAHCLSIWGYDFRPAYLGIGSFVKCLKKRPVIACFTATATTFTLDDLTGFLHLKKPYMSVIPASIGKKDRIQLRIQECPKTKNEKDSRYSQMYAFLERENHLRQKGIIYCSTVERVEQLYRILVHHNQNANERSGLFRVAKYHGQMTLQEREENYLNFISLEGANIMVATNAFGMGVDIDDIGYIIHFEIPSDIEQYCQELGRAGRNGQLVEDVLLYSEEDPSIQLHKNIYDNETAHEKVEDYRFLEMLKLIERSRSRHLRSEEIWDEIDAYFVNQRGYNLFYEKIQDEIELERKERIAKTHEVNQLMILQTKLNSVLRNGKYSANEITKVDIGGKRMDSFMISQKLDYFDWMVLDALCSLYFFGHEKVFVQNILELLCGDSEAKMKSDFKQEIIECVERLGNTTILLSGFDGMIYAGNLVELQREGKNAYLITDTPLLYQYAERRRQVETINRSWLHIVSENNRDRRTELIHSKENMMLIFFLLNRCILFNRDRRRNPTLQSYSKIQKIRFIHTDARRAGMYEILGIELPERKDLCERKKKIVNHKVELIMNYYKNQKFIPSWQFYSKEKTSEIIGVRILNQEDYDWGFDLDWFEKYADLV